MICMSQMRLQSILTLHDAMRGFKILGKGTNFHVVGMGPLHASTRRYHEVVLRQARGLKGHSLMEYWFVLLGMLQRDVVVRFKIWAIGTTVRGQVSVYWTFHG